MAFVVIDNSPAPSVWAINRTMSSKSGRSVGSPSGEPEFAEPDRDSRAHYAGYFLRGQQMFSGKEVQAVDRHAVHAPQITMVCYGDAEIVDVALV